MHWSAKLRSLTGPVLLLMLLWTLYCSCYKQFLEDYECTPPDLYTNVSDTHNVSTVTPGGHVIVNPRVQPFWRLFAQNGVLAIAGCHHISRSFLVDVSVPQGLFISGLFTITSCYKPDIWTLSPLRLNPLGKLYYGLMLHVEILEPGASDFMYLMKNLCWSDIPMSLFMAKSKNYIAFLMQGHIPWAIFTFQATPRSLMENLVVEFFTNTSGSVTQPGFDAVNYVRYFTFMDASYTLVVPDQHVVLTSFPVFLLVAAHKGKCKDFLTLTTLGSHHRSQVWKKCGRQSIQARVFRHNLLITMSSTYVKHRLKEIGFKMLFSLHTKEEAPQEVDDGLFDCSVSHYPAFQIHFHCNLKQECRGREDEGGHCPFSSAQCDGGVAVNSKCYFFLETNRLRTWTEVKSMCMEAKADLPVMKTPQEWAAFETLFAISLTTRKAHVGLVLDRTGTSMYHKTWQWIDTSKEFHVDVKMCHDLFYVSATNHLQRTATYNRFLKYDLVITIEYNTKADSVVCETQSNQTQSSEQTTVHLAEILNPVQAATKVKTPLVQCPLGHLTHEFLSCDIKAHCFRTDLYSACVSPSSDVNIPMFQCSEGGTIAYTLVCDGERSCIKDNDWSDESFCRPAPCPCVLLGEKLDTDECPDDYRDCEFEECVPLEVTNWEVKYLNVGKREKTGRLRPPLIIDCYNRYNLSQTQLDNCPDTHFYCEGRLADCLPVYMRCNGVLDCPLGEDETLCDNFTCAGYYRCRAFQMCVHPSQLCDGIFQCPQHDDELLCHMTCPAECQCQGLAWLCPEPFEGNITRDLRYLNAEGSGILPLHLNHNVYLIALVLGKCKISELHTLELVHLHSLDLNRNNIRSLDLSVFLQMPQLRELNLAGNPLSWLTFNTHNSTSPGYLGLVSLDLSATLLVQLSRAVFLKLPLLKELVLRDMAFSDHFMSRDIGRQLYTLAEGKEIATMMISFNITTLDLRGSFFADIAQDMLTDFPQLSVLFTSHYKACCKRFFPHQHLQCYTSDDEISSCQYLIRSQIYLICFWLMSGVSILGNMVSFVFRTLTERCSIKGPLHIFLACLNVANGLHGLHLLLVVTSHHRYIGLFAWMDTAWRKSSTCQAAGFLIGLSCRLSVFFLCLINLDRVLAIRLSKRGLEFHVWSSVMVSCLVWVLAMVLQTLPFLSESTSWTLSDHGVLCNPFMAHFRRPSSFRHSVGIFHIINLLLYSFTLSVKIKVGKMALLLLGSLPSMAGKTYAFETSLSLTSRLNPTITINCIIWILIACLGVVDYVGFQLQRQFLVLVAIVVLPLCSALNPVLYFLSAWVEARRREKQQRLLQVMMSKARLRSKRTQRTADSSLRTTDSSQRTTDSSQREDLTRLDLCLRMSSVDMDTLQTAIDKHCTS